MFKNVKGIGKINSLLKMRDKLMKWAEYREKHVIANSIRIGTRQSPLALKQTDRIAKKLKKLTLLSY